PDLVGARDAAVRRVDALLAETTRTARHGEERIVVVGGTGHLGPYLLRELLAQQDRPLTVLLRAPDGPTAERRLRTLLTDRSLWTAGDADRLRVLPADLRRPRFGLSDHDWTRLAAEATAVYHCAAEVNFVRPYDQMEPANVHATEMAVRLVAESGRAHLHFLSTLGVLRQENPTGDPYPEEPLPATPGLLPNGYLQTKWVAEHVVQRAMAAGVPASIYRICAVAGDSVTGYCNHEDLFWRIVGTAVATGLAPRRDAEIVSMSVDSAARALVAGALRSGGAIAHLAPPPVTWTTVWAWVRACGYDIEEIPAEQWRADVARRVAAGADLPLASVVSSLDVLMPDEPRRFAAATMTDLLRDTGIDVPALDPESLEVSVDHLMSLPSTGNGGMSPPPPTGGGMSPPSPTGGGRLPDERKNDE
ncbi:MAG: thioester reductase domain-containing protein, partial [Actinocatenispora sp.]